MDGIKTEPDSDSDLEPVSALCETELMDVKEDSAGANGLSSITAEVQFCDNLYSSRNMEMAYLHIKIIVVISLCIWLDVLWSKLLAALLNEQTNK